MTWLKAQGYAPDEVLLRDLQLAANCAKHGPGDFPSRRLVARPDLFDQGDVDAFPASTRVTTTLGSTARHFRRFLRLYPGPGPSRIGLENQPM